MGQNSTLKKPRGLFSCCVNINIFTHHWSLQYTEVMPFSIGPGETRLPGNYRLALRVMYVPWTLRCENSVWSSQCRRRRFPPMTMSNLAEVAACDLKGFLSVFQVNVPELSLFTDYSPWHSLPSLPASSGIRLLLHMAFTSSTLLQLFLVKVCIYIKGA